MVLEMQADKQVSKAIILAQCDNLISNNLLKKKGRQIMSMVEDIDYDYISNWIVTDNRYKKCAETLKSAIMKLLVQVIFLSMMHLVAMVCSTIVMCLLWFLRDVMFCCTISVLYFNQ